MIVQIKCRQCAVTIRYDPTQLVSCNCDPDDTSWIALDKNAKLIKMSGANIEILEEK